jgi:hypothetical protein
MAQQSKTIAVGKRIIWFGITRHPTAEWLARQINHPGERCKLAE